MRIVLDTNVLVSAFLNPHGTPARILDLVLSSSVVVLFDDRILAQYRDVLTRPKLRIAPFEAAFLLDFVERDGILVSVPPLALELPDPKDLPFVEVAAETSADALITGNTRHFQPATAAIAVPILSPAEFILRWNARSG